MQETTDNTPVDSFLCFLTRRCCGVSEMTYLVIYLLIYLGPRHTARRCLPTLSVVILTLFCVSAETHSYPCGVVVDPLGQLALYCAVLREIFMQSSAPCLAQRLDSPRPDPDRKTTSHGAPESQQRPRKETRWLMARRWYHGSRGAVSRGM